MIVRNFKNKSRLYVNFQFWYLTIFNIYLKMGSTKTRFEFKTNISGQRNKEISDWLYIAYHLCRPFDGWELPSSPWWYCSQQSECSFDYHDNEVEDQGSLFHPTQSVLNERKINNICLIRLLTSFYMIRVIDEVGF